jgi:deazaflavin-dependent oxidoreductase (nitroreductase family)
MGSNTLPDAVRAFIEGHLDLYLRSGGAQGHVTDGRRSGGPFFTPNCLLKFKGRKSGRTMITPLTYGMIGGEVVIVASKGGADAHPAWYLNVVEMPEIEFQVATQAFRATWREPKGAEREKVWAFISETYPFYADYQTRTERQIPIVMMKPYEEIPVFQLSDITP